MALEKGDAEAWRTWTEKLDQENPNSPVALYLLGDALARNGDLNQAEVHFTSALELDPKFGLALVARGTVEAITGRTDDAYIDLTQATQVEPALRMLRQVWVI